MRCFQTPQEPGHQLDVSHRPVQLLRGVVVVLCSEGGGHHLGNEGRRVMVIVQVASFLLWVLGMGVWGKLLS